MKTVNEIEKEAMEKFAQSWVNNDRRVTKTRLTPVHEDAVKKPLKLTKSITWVQLISFLLWSLVVILMAYCSLY